MPDGCRFLTQRWEEPCHPALQLILRHLLGNVMQQAHRPGDRFIQSVCLRQLCGQLRHPHAVRIALCGKTTFDKALQIQMMLGDITAYTRMQRIPFLSAADLAGTDIHQLHRLIAQRIRCMLYHIGTGAGKHDERHFFQQCIHLFPGRQLRCLIAADQPEERKGRITALQLPHRIDRIGLSFPLQLQPATVNVTIGGDGPLDHRRAVSGRRERPIL